MDLGCEKTVQGLSLRNVRNYHHHDRSTKKFRLLGSPNNNESWKELIVADLEDSRKQIPPPIQNLTLDNSVIVRFVKFELLEYWGNLGGGLQYFKVITGWAGFKKIFARIPPIPLLGFCKCCSPLLRIGGIWGKLSPKVGT